MIEVVGVRFRANERICYLDPQNEKYSKNQFVVAETKKNYRCGKIVIANTNISPDIVTQPLSKIIRVADKNDIKKLKQNTFREIEAAKVFRKKVSEHDLKMKLIDVECIFLSNKILFHFTADGRVDFRSLVRDLASTLRARIELKQIGVRDEARMMGGLGSCGKPFCCATFLDDFHSVSIKMAKEQGLSLNPTKISGTCGRLMCCLKFEQAAYSDLIKNTPKIGTVVKTADGIGKVVEQNLLTGNLHVQLLDNPDSIPIIVNKKDVSIT